jgi:outer membrane receptor protein involved in Fe transport
MSSRIRKQVELPKASNSNDVLLPSVMLRWAITKDLMARGSCAETFSLPTFAQLNPYVQYFADVTNIGYGTASGGNPDLKPVESRNYDVSLEWYFSKGSVLYGTWFKRDIRNNIATYRNVVQYNDPDDNPDRGLYNYILTQPDNTGDATLDGFEFGATWFPKLDGWLNGIGPGQPDDLNSERQSHPGRAGQCHQRGHHGHHGCVEDVVQRDARLRPAEVQCPPVVFLARQLP